MMTPIRALRPSVITYHLLAEARQMPQTALVLSAFNVLSNIAVAAYGIKELTLDIFSIRRLKHQELNRKQRISRVFFKSLALIYNPARTLSEKIIAIAHGTFYVVSGVAGVLSELPRFVKSGASLKLRYISAATFFVGNVFYLYVNIRNFIKSFDDKTANGKKMRQSALFGICNTLSYMALSVTAFLSAPGFAVLGFASLGMLTGLIKIVLDTIS